MGSTNFLSFNDRTRRFKKHRKRIARGYRTEVRPDGLIVYRPKPASGWFLKSIASLIAGLVAFKVFLYVFLSPLTYAERVEKLSTGTEVEQAGAWIMQADALTIALGDFVRFALTSLGL